MSLRSFLSKVDISALEADIDTLLERLTAARATRIDYLDALISSIIKFLGKGTGTEVPDNKSLYDLIALDRLDILQFEKSFAGTEQFKDINVTTADQSLGSQTLNVTLPIGATIRAAIAVTLIQIMNDVATMQKIDVKLEVDGNVVFNQNDCVGLSAAEGASSPFTIVEDVSSIITATGNHILEGKVTLSDAHSTHFTTAYALIIIYRRS